MDLTGLVTGRKSKLTEYERKIKDGKINLKKGIYYDYLSNMITEDIEYLQTMLEEKSREDPDYFRNSSKNNYIYALIKIIIDKLNIINNNIGIMKRVYITQIEELINKNTYSQTHLLEDINKVLMEKEKFFKDLVYIRTFYMKKFKMLKYENDEIYNEYAHFLEKWKNEFTNKENIEKLYNDTKKYINTLNGNTLKGNTLNGGRHNKSIYTVMNMKYIKGLCKANQIKLSTTKNDKRVIYKKKELITKLKRKKII